MWCSTWPSESVNPAGEAWIHMSSFEERAREIEFHSFLKYDDL